MPYFKEALEQLTGDTNRERGTKFERLMRAALERHPGEYGKLRFKQVMMWSDWAAEQPDETRQDTGIDLVGEEHSGRLCAIQCKFYAQDHSLSQPDLDSFIAASSNTKFSSRILIFTGAELNTNAQKRLEKTDEPQIEMINRHDLEDWNIDDWRIFVNDPETLVFSPSKPKIPRPYQQKAVEAIIDGFENSDKGKLILPCGTGKTLIHLWVAEQLAGKGGKVLYVMPSLSLIAQTMREWANNRSPEIDHSYIAVCSDTSVGKNSDTGGSIDELPAPATTNPEKVAELLRNTPEDRMSVVFASYQSLEVVADAQAEAKVIFDFVVCDEAHRTTGIEDYDKSGSKKGQLSGFRLIHNQFWIERECILFSTATPRLYTPAVKSKVDDANAKEGAGKYGIYSMDDEEAYGKEFYRLKFSEAIRDGHLAEYQVIAVGVDESDPYIQAALDRIKVTAEESGQVKESKNLEGGKTYYGLSPLEVISLLGFWDGLANPNTQGVRENRVVGTLEESGFHARKAIAFTNTIEASKGVSKAMESAISVIRNHPQVKPEAKERLLNLDVRHIDGKMSSLRRARDLDWLRGTDKEDNEARLLSNARCLTEGVDVPDLDAVLFLSPRRSLIDIVQAVGRVMRQPVGAKQQKTGYIILPVLIPESKTMEETIDEGQSGWSRVWAILNALKSHDDRLEAWIDSADLTQSSEYNPFKVIDPKPSPFSVPNHAIQGQLDLKAADAIASKIVLTCGSKQWWPSWGVEAKEILISIEELLEKQIDNNSASRKAFDDYLFEMRETLNESLPSRELLELLAQHVLTYPIFETLRRERGNNPIGIAFEKALKKIFGRSNWRMEGEIPELLSPLSVFYAGVRERSKIANTSEAKTRLVIDIYDSFFAEALPKAQAQLGIAYTPTWIVDFILRSADAVSQEEFGVGITSQNVRFLDPFTGTGTFVSRLLSEDVKQGVPLIEAQDVEHKYHHEIHAAEMQPLAYHIASLQIAESYIERTNRNDAVPFQNIVLADTFKLSSSSEQQELIYDDGLLENDDRKQAQRRRNITIIATNPPWSSGQDSASEDQKVESDEKIAKRVKETYVARHKEITGRSPGGNAAGNRYIQSLRWMTDRLSAGAEAQDSGTEEREVFIPQLGKGIVAFLHPNSLANGTSLAGVRACLRDEFDKIYVVNLRGDAYKSGEEARRDGANVFEGRSRNGVQITICVSRDSKSLERKSAELLYSEVPDYSQLEEKKEWLAQLEDVVTGRKAGKFDVVPENDKHDWVNITDGSFDAMLEVCSTDKAKSELGIGVAACSHASGVKTNCDTYAYSFSHSHLTNKVLALIAHYEEVRELLHPDGTTISTRKDDEDLKELTAHTHETMEAIKWTDTLKDSVRRNLPLVFDKSRIREVLYRPFQKLFLYEDDRILSSVKTVSRMFPRDEATHTHTHTLTLSLLISDPQPRHTFSIQASRTLHDLNSFNIASRGIPRQRR